MRLCLPHDKMHFRFHLNVSQAPYLCVKLLIDTIKNAGSHWQSRLITSKKAKRRTLSSPWRNQIEFSRVELVNSARSENVIWLSNNKFHYFFPLVYQVKCSRDVLALAFSDELHYKCNWNSQTAVLGEKLSQLLDPLHDKLHSWTSFASNLWFIGTNRFSLCRNAEK